jgi:hypothetical protein
VLLNSLEDEKTTVHDHSMLVVKDEVDREGCQTNLASALGDDLLAQPLYAFRSSSGIWSSLGHLDAFLMGAHDIRTQMVDTRHEIVGV